MTHVPMNTDPRSKAQSRFVQPDLGALVASRICHDLISPMGAIGNGLELLQLSQGVSGPEIDLISASIAHANTRLRLYRLAFGMVGEDQMISQGEITSLLQTLSMQGRHQYRWSASGHLNRRQSKLVFLLLLCLETALPWGGEIVISDAPGGLQLAAMSDRVKLEEELWQMLEHRRVDVDLSAAKVHFGLLAHELRNQAAALSLVQEPGALVLHLRHSTRSPSADLSQT